jgi:glycosyltransferase involved in cell wall biosynthesis
MPFRGIPHAGGEYYRRHVELAATTHEVVVMCPSTPDNEAAMVHEEGPPYRRVLVTPMTQCQLPAPGHEPTLVTRAVPFLAVRGFWRGLLRDETAVAALRTADRIELQWFDAIVLAPRLKKLFPATPLIGVFHDVVTQGQERAMVARSAPLRSRLLALIRWLFALPLEKRVMKFLDTAVVLSEKDKVLLERRGGSAAITVVAPPLDDIDMPEDPRPTRREGAEVLFVGALWRIENEDAARWMLDEIWPQVRTAVPGARLTIAGGGPSPALERCAARYDDVQLTGYVKSLSPQYARASVVVAPMRLGAGVKLKSVVAMLWGIPVVATEVGAEGVAGPDVFVAVENDGVAFAKAVVQVLRAPESVRDVLVRAHRWAHATYSTESYLGALEAIYA